jgi:hypothetical protein
MALQIAFDAPTGDSYGAALVRVDGVAFDFVGRRVEILVAWFRDASAAAAGKAPAQTRQIVMTAAEFQSVFGGQADPRPRIYAYLKTLSAFAGATDA